MVSPSSKTIPAFFHSSSISFLSSFKSPTVERLNIFFWTPSTSRWLGLPILEATPKVGPTVVPPARPVAAASTTPLPQIGTDDSPDKYSP